MDGPNVNTSPLDRFAAYVRTAALAAGYDVDRVNSGAKADLARAAGMSPSSVSRLLRAERMPDAEYLAPLARALRLNPIDLLVESGILPPESRSQPDTNAVASTPITPDAVADSWGVDAFGREMVRAMFDRLTRPAEPQPSREDDDLGGAAQG
jgi:transcriptional regulator with XRE-family HTH domain